MTMGSSKPARITGGDTIVKELRQHLEQAADLVRLGEWEQKRRKVAELRRRGREALDARQGELALLMPDEAD